MQFTAAESRGTNSLTVRSNTKVGRKRYPRFPMVVATVWPFPFPSFPTISLGGQALKPNRHQRKHRPTNESHRTN